MGPIKRLPAPMYQQESPSPLYRFLFMVTSNLILTRHELMLIEPGTYEQ